MDTHTENLRHKNLTVGELEVAALEAGPDDGQLVICLHGFPDSAWTWSNMLPALAESGYHAVAPFLRGYAPTGLAPDGSYQTGALAMDVCGLEEALRGGADGDTPSFVVGHDWGALAAYGAAGLRPERFAKVVGMGLPPVAAAASTFFSYDQIKRSFYVFLFQTPLAELAVAADDYKFIDRLWADWSPGYDGRGDVARAKEAIGTPERLAAAIGYYRAMFDTSKHLPVYEMAQQAASSSPPQPTLYLHGAEDGCMRVGSMSEVLSVLSEGSEAVLVAGAGHFLHLERPEEVHANVLRFITS